QSHYEKALALQADYLPAVNNFGLSKLQWAQQNGRPELEQEGEALLARAVSLSSEPDQLSSTHQAIRAELAAKMAARAVPAPAPVLAPTPPLPPRTAWLERRSENYTFVVTKPSLALADAMALNLDPSLALVSPGSTMATTFISLAGQAPRFR